VNYTEITRPYVVLSVAMSIDGYIDDAGPQRLLLSNPADFDRVDEVRAQADAILVGARALRRDDARLTVKSAARVARRVAAGKRAHPLRVTVTRGGELDPGLRIWQDDGDRLVYTTDAARPGLAARLAGLAEVVGLGAEVDFGALLDDLGARGVRRLLVEGGGQIHTAFLSADLADELHLAVAPLFVGEADAPRFLHPADYPAGRLVLAEAGRVGDVALLRYLLRPAPDAA
jgi:5-amino-6-(5-phosphoribosylamino)uracil reductase